MSVQISGEIEGFAEPIQVRGLCQVRWCAEAGDGLYQAGLAFENAGDVPRRAAEMIGNGVDHYKALQVSRRADTETVRCAAELMARRYRDAGDEEFRQNVVRAGDVLCDPARRAAFDIQLASHDRVRLHLFENWQSSRDAQAEIRKRQVLLRLLLNKHLSDSVKPWIVVRDFENLMGCPREHLEFSLWVLREGKLVTCGDNSRYQITSHGVAALEEEVTSGERPATYPLPPATVRPVN